ncbi:MAG: flagellar filament capping protein FliD, partial [Spirochaetota bacterium]
MDNVIPGVTLELNKESDKSIKLSIDPDRKSIKDSVIAFIGYYNQLLTNIQIFTRTDENIVDSVEYFTEEEKKKAKERLGVLQGDVTLMQLKSRLQQIMMDPYPAGENAQISLLAQIGVSTNAAPLARSGGMDASKLRGYLEINEQILDGVLKNNLPAVQKLFGNDTDGDLVIDSGVAYAVDIHARPYIQSGGIIAQRLNNLETQIGRANQEIENYNKKLAQKEQ